jgi:hypothetical protein
LDSSIVFGFIDSGQHDIHDIHDIYGIHDGDA